MSDGETPEEALANLDDAKKCWIETNLELGHPVPEPGLDNFSGQLRLRMPRSLHRALSEKAKDERVSLLSAGERDRLPGIFVPEVRRENVCLTVGRRRLGLLHSP